jgi:hypothetical protein
MLKKKKELDIDFVTLDTSLLFGIDGEVLRRKKERCDKAVLLGTVESTVNNEVRCSPVVLLPDGQVGRTYGYSRASKPLVKVLGDSGLRPHLNMDPFMERCFEVGYSEVDIGPSSYNGCFGVKCSYEKEKEPRDSSGRPAVWRIAAEFGLSNGCGGHHSFQLLHFTPTGRYGFGRWKP